MAIQDFIFIHHPLLVTNLDTIWFTAHFEAKTLKVLKTSNYNTAMNSKFGDVEETGILISIDDIFPEKKNRHVNTYKKAK